MIRKRNSKQKSAPKKRPPWNLNSKIRSALRQVWRYSPMRLEALRAAKVGWGRYQCALCQDTFGPKEVQVDHMLGCGPVDDLNEYRRRLFCDSSFLRILCKPCHKAFTAEQREEAKKARASKKACQPSTGILAPLQ